MLSSGCELPGIEIGSVRHSEKAMLGLREEDMCDPAEHRCQPLAAAGRRPDIGSR